MTEITLNAKDGVKMKTSLDAMKIFRVVDNFFRDCKPGDEMPVEIGGPTLMKITKFAEEYKNRGIPVIERPIKTNRLEALFKTEFLVSYMTCPAKELCELLMAGHYLDCKAFEDLIACAIAAQLFGKSTEEMRTAFGIKNDFTPEEQRSVNEFYSWADDIWP